VSPPAESIPPNRITSLPRWESPSDSGKRENALGHLWTNMLGEKWTRFATKYVFSVITLIFGGLVLFGSFEIR
jgi:hypothetical protein